MSLIVDISKKLGGFTLKAQLEARPGEAMALLGPSGCGKSVTLKCIAGLMSPDSGAIELNGRTLFHSGRGVSLRPQKRRVGYLFQSYALFPNMTVLDNVRCGMGKDKSAARDMLAKFRLEGLEGLYPHQLSGGQQQRVALARILASSPEAILLDEPLSALDSHLKWELELELYELLKPFGGPVVWVAHDMGECRRNCAAVCPMDGGATSPAISMEELMRRPRTAAEAKLAGCKCFVRAEPCVGGAHIPEWGVTLEAALPGGPCTLGIPDDAASVGSGFPCAVVRLIPDLGRTIALLRPAGAAEGSALMRAELREAGPAEGDTVCVNLDADRVLRL